VNIKTVFYKTIVSFIFLSILLAACGSSDMSGSNNRVYGIDKSFRDFYKKMGGVEVLGPVISEVFFWEENQ
jgi:major membrane immunogen (membrane-anchored lipoprotein)